MKYYWLYALALMSFVVGCASAPRVGKGIPPEELFNSACQPGKNVQSAQGSVWLKANSDEVSGQFSANVLSTAPNHLKLEVTNFLGGTEALITVDQEHYQITKPDGKEKQDEGYGSWGGIPLRWATDLFLGKVPCPAPSKDLHLSVDGQGDLVVIVPESAGVEPQRFVFSFRQNAGKPWPDVLHWERRVAPFISVDFKFDDPEDETLSPKKWEAKSSRGSVKARWRDREITKIKG